MVRMYRHLMCGFATLALLWFGHVPHACAALQLSVNQRQIDFGSLDPGATQSNIPPNGLTARVSSNAGGAEPAWILLIGCREPFTHQQNPSQSIPEQNFFWSGVSTSGRGRLENAQHDFTQERVIYNSPGGEADVEVTIKFKLQLPDWLQAGDYGTHVVFTLTE